VYLYRQLIDEIRKGAKKASFDLGKTFVENPQEKLKEVPEEVLKKVKGRLIYYWDGKELIPLALFDDRYYALTWTHNAPILEIDGIRMHVFYLGSPFKYAQYVARVVRGGKKYLETCFGQGYISRLIDEELVSYEKNRAVLELAKMNPWSQDALKKHTVKNASIWDLEEEGFDRIIHDPPSFRIAEDLYSEKFYKMLADHSKKGALMYHYIGEPKKRQRFDLGAHVIQKAQRAGWRLLRRDDKVKALVFKLL